MPIRIAGTKTTALYSTFDVLDTIRKQLNGAHVTGLRYPCSIKSQAYKLRDRPETRYGDIAIVVRLTSWDREVIEGVGFLEAKKRSLRNQSFEAFKPTQAQRISRRAPLWTLFEGSPTATPAA